MPGSSNLKLKLLYLMKILLEKTDAQNPLTISEIITELAVYGVSAERKSLYIDIETLREFGLDIETTRSKTTGYYIASRKFELPELKLLVDAVQSSRLITNKKSDDLIQKLSTLTSVAQAKQLKRQVFVSGRAKSFNEASYYSIDAVHNAINDGKKIEFRYFDYDVNKNKVFRKDSGWYKATPITMCWDEDKYYLVTYSAEHDELRNYRVDRMSDAKALDEDADSFDPVRFDVAAHIKLSFGMYSGKIIRAKLLFENSLINVVLDHFGKDVIMNPSKEGFIEVTADVPISPVFLGWMLQFGKRAAILGPDSLTSAMRVLITENAEIYGLEVTLNPLI